jgi:hypothetical protein
VGPDSSVDFDGYYGEYEVVVDGETFLIDHGKDTPVHTLVASGYFPGDFNNDHLVNGADAMLWLRNPSIGNLSDWETHYGFSEFGAATEVVPEPSGIGLLGGALIVSATGLRRRRKLRAEKRYLKPENSGR